MALLEDAERRRLIGSVKSLTQRGPDQAREQRYGGMVGLCVGVLSILGCESKSVIAAWSCPGSSEASSLGAEGSAGDAGSGGSSSSSTSFPLHWSTSFENGWCDFYDGRGEFAESGERTKDVVTEPVHSGSFAAAFTVNTTNVGQMRCARQGLLPSEAKYGVWYFVPKLARLAESKAIWNLLHFRGDNAENFGHLWDVSLVNNASGDLRLEVFNYWVKLPDQSRAPAIPIGAWFHIEFYWKRAADETGEVTVYQDGVAVFQVTNVQTDNSSGSVQWLVGNYAHLLDPVESTVYVDDVTIDSPR